MSGRDEYDESLAAARGVLWGVAVSLGFWAALAVTIWGIVAE